MDIKEKYQNLINKCDHFEIKGKNMLYTSANGHMFSTLNKYGELGIRFSKEVQEKYLSEYNTKQFMSYGSKMKGYILITDEMWKDEHLLIKLLNESYNYVMELESK